MTLRDGPGLVVVASGTRWPSRRCRSPEASNAAAGKASWCRRRAAPCRSGSRRVERRHVPCMPYHAHRRADPARLVAPAAPSELPGRPGRAGPAQDRAGCAPTPRRRPVGGRSTSRRSAVAAPRAAALAAWAAADPRPEVRVEPGRPAGAASSTVPVPSASGTNARRPAGGPPARTTCRGRAGRIAGRSAVQRGHPDRAAPGGSVTASGAPRVASGRRPGPARSRRLSSAAPPRGRRGRGRAAGAVGQGREAAAGRGQHQRRARSFPARRVVAAATSRATARQASAAAPCHVPWPAPAPGCTASGTARAQSCLAPPLSGLPAATRRAPRGGRRRVVGWPWPLEPS